jgi:CheY-like chemotaxis protein
MDPFGFYALVVDDNPLIRLDAQTILTKAGFRVFAAAGCDEALEVLSAHGHGIGLLFTDIEMPPDLKTGLDLARYCASGWPHIGILVASGSTRPDAGKLPNGAIFIHKPFDDAVIRRHLRQLLPEQQQPTRLKMASM